MKAADGGRTRRASSSLDEPSESGSVEPRELRDGGAMAQLTQPQAGVVA